MAEIIKFPSQNISSDPIPNPLDTLLFDLIKESNIILNQSLFSSPIQIIASFQNTDISNLDLEYSIDDITYQTSNTLDVPSIGTYIIYIKDKFGCKKSKQINVISSELMNREDFIYISKSNSIDFVKIQEKDNVNIFHNEVNSFQCENLSQITYNEDLLFNKKDVPSLQIKSNYKQLKVYLRNELGKTAIIPMFKRSNNLDNFYSLDGFVYSNDSDKLSMYFESGNIYDSSGSVIDQHNLQGDLPEFARVGNYVRVEGFGNLIISNILIDYELNKNTIVFDEEYTGVEVGVVALSVYDLLPYEIYEDYFNLTVLKNGLYDIYVKATNNQNEIVEFLSYNINVKDSHDETLSIHYYNESNRSLFYEYGLINQIRVKYSSVKRFNNEESEININSENSQSVNSRLNFGNSFLFEGLTTKQVDTLSLALSSENVFINGLGYLKSNDIKINNYENTNIYSLEVDMLLTNINLKIENERESSTSLLFLEEIDFVIPNIFPMM